MISIIYTKKYLLSTDRESINVHELESYNVEFEQLLNVASVVNYLTLVSCQKPESLNVFEG